MAVFEIMSTHFVVIKSSEVLKYFFSYALSKMDLLLLNSNKRCESEDQSVIRVRRSVKIENMMTALWALVLRRQKSMEKTSRNVFCV
jgi:hypothetical protein